MKRRATQGRLPCGHRSALNPERLPQSGWTLSALPYLEQQAVFDAARAAYLATPNPFGGPPHVGLATVIPAFTCPSDGRTGTAQVSQVFGVRAAFTSYLGVQGRDHRTRDGLLFEDSRVRLTDATDGLSNTLLLGERPPSADLELGWWYAGVGFSASGSAEMVLGTRDVSLASYGLALLCAPGPRHFAAASGVGDPCGVFHFWSLHPGGANFALADGSVRFLTYSADTILPALASRAGGEAVEIP